MFFKFQSGSHRISLGSKNFILLELIMLSKIYLGLIFYFKIICRLGGTMV